MLWADDCMCVLNTCVYVCVEYMCVCVCACVEYIFVSVVSRCVYVRSKCVVVPDWITQRAAASLSACPPSRAQNRSSCCYENV